MPHPADLPPLFCMQGGGEGGSDLQRQLAQAARRSVDRSYTAGTDEKIATVFPSFERWVATGGGGIHYFPDV